MASHKELIPEYLVKAYWGNYIIAEVFDTAVYTDKTREWALVQCIKSLLKRTGPMYLNVPHSELSFKPWPNCKTLP